MTETDITPFSFPTEAADIKIIDIEMLSEHPNLQELGLEAKERTVKGIFLFSACVKALKEHSATIIKGGTTFGTLAEEWWGLSASESSRWLKIGDNSELLDNIQNLPDSYRSISILAGLDKKDIAKGIKDNVINATATQKSIAAFKAKVLKEPKAKEVYYLTREEKNLIRNALTGKELDIFNKAFPEKKDKKEPS